MDPKIFMMKTLVVDDYEPLREATIEILKSNGFEKVLDAESPEDGMRLFKEHEPELIILDIIMPTVNGIELIGEIKKKNPKAKVVMLSVLSDESTKQKALKAGADLYLVKPLISEKVKEIKKLLEMK